jgi:hypothetical protein
MIDGLAPHITLVTSEFLLLISSHPPEELAKADLGKPYEHAM